MAFTSAEITTVSSAPLFPALSSPRYTSRADSAARPPAETLSAALCRARQTPFPPATARVRIDGPATDNLVIGNALLTGSFFGVEVRSAPSSNLFAVNNRIGGPTQAERNLISGAGKYGEEGFPTGGQVSLQDAIGTIVQGNYIGTNAAGTASFGQRGPFGIQARNAAGTQILDNLISGILVVGTNHYAGQRFGTGISLSG